MSPKRSITPQVSRHCSGDLFTSLSAASLMMFALLAGPIFAPTTTVTYPTAGLQNGVYNSAVSANIQINQGAGTYGLDVQSAFRQITVQPQSNPAPGALTITMSNCFAGSNPAITFSGLNNIQLSSITIVLKCPWLNQGTLMEIGSGTPLTVTVDIFSSVSLSGSGDDLIRINDNSWSTRPSLFAVNIYSGSTKISKSAGSDWGPFVFSDAPSGGSRSSSSNMKLFLSSGASVTLSSSSGYPAAIFGFSNNVNSLPAMSIGIVGSTVTAISSSALVALGATMPIPSFTMSVTSSTIVLKQSSSVVTVDKQNSGGSDAPYSFIGAVSLSFTSSSLSLFGASSIFDIVSAISNSGAFYFTSTIVDLVSSSSLVSGYASSSGTFNGLSFVMDNATVTVSSSSGLVLGNTMTANGVTFTMMNNSVAIIDGAVLMSVSAVWTSTCIFTLNSSAMLGLLGNSVALKVVNSVAGISLSMTSGAAMTVSSGSSFFTGSRLCSWSSTLSNYASISVVSCTFLATTYVTYVADSLTNTANISLRSSTWLSAVYTSMPFVSTIATSSRVELLSQSQWVKSSLIGSNAPRLEVSGSGSLLVSDRSTWWSGTTVNMWSVSVLSASQVTLQKGSQLLQFISGSGGGGCAVTVDGVSTSVSVVDQSSLWSTAAALSFSIESLGGTGHVAVLQSSTLLNVTSASLPSVRVSIVNTAVEFTPSSSVGWLLQGPSLLTTSSVAVSLIGTSFVCRESPHWDVCRQRWMSGVSRLPTAVNVTSSTLRWGTRQRAIPTQNPFAIAGTTNNRVDLNDGNLGGSESKSQTQTSLPSESADFTSSQSASQSSSSSSSATSVTPSAVATSSWSEQTTVSVSPNSSLSALRTVSSSSSQDTRTHSHSQQLSLSVLSPSSSMTPSSSTSMTSGTPDSPSLAITGTPRKRPTATAAMTPSRGSSSASPTVSLGSASASTVSASQRSRSAALTTSFVPVVSATVAADASASGVVTATQTVLPPAPTAISRLETATVQTTQTIGSTSAVVSSVTGGDAASANVMVLLSTLSCATSGQSLDTLAISAAALSMFGRYGFLAMSLGNVGLIVVLVVVHWVCTVVLHATGDAGEDNRRRDPYDTAEGLDGRTSLLHTRAAKTLRFPSLSLYAIDLLLPPALFGGAAAVATSLGSGATLAVWDLAGGLVSCVCVVLAACVKSVLLERCVLRERRRVDAGDSVVCAGSGAAVTGATVWLSDVHVIEPGVFVAAAAVSPLPACDRPLYPAVLWRPLRLRQTFGSLFLKFKSRGFARCVGPLELVVPLVTSVLSVVATTGHAACVVSSCLLTLVYFGAAVGGAVVRPMRLPVNNVAIVVQFGVFCVTCVLKALSVADDIPDRLQLLQSGILIVKVVLGLLLAYREGEWNAVMDGTQTVDFVGDELDNAAPLLLCDYSGSPFFDGAAGHMPVEELQSIGSTRTLSVCSDLISDVGSNGEWLMAAESHTYDSSDDGSHQFEVLQQRAVDAAPSGGEASCCVVLDLLARRGDNDKQGGWDDLLVELYRNAAAVECQPSVHQCEVHDAMELSLVLDR